MATGESEGRGTESAELPCSCSGGEKGVCVRWRGGAARASGQFDAYLGSTGQFLVRGGGQGRGTASQSGGHHGPYRHCHLSLRWPRPAPQGAQPLLFLRYGFLPVEPHLRSRRPTPQVLISLSYHAMAADDNQVYVFGGCGEKGRLNDLWAFNVEEGKWKALPAPPPESKLVPRGGPGLVVVDNKVWVVFGFGGKHELSDIHRFDLCTNLWEEVEVKGEVKPTPRSVFACAAVGKYIAVYGGEVDPSDLGHMGAGSFCGDVFALDTEALEWIRVEDVGGESHPGPRGWSAFSVGSCCGSKGLLVYGGNSPSNKRLEDIFFLQLAA